LQSFLVDRNVNSQGQLLREASAGVDGGGARVGFIRRDDAVSKRGKSARSID
jgi:hypothetical protein